MRLKKQAIAVVSVFAMGGALAACGDNDNDTSATSAASSVAESATSTAAESEDDGVTFEDAYCQAKPDAADVPEGGMGDMTACFGTLVNNTDNDVTITGYTIDELEGEPSLELHETVDGQMRQKEGGFELAAGESLKLAPGGEHMMIRNYAPAINAGDDLTVTFQTQDGEDFEVTVPVRDGAAGNEADGNGSTGMDHGAGMDHGDMGQSEQPEPAQ